MLKPADDEEVIASLRKAIEELDRRLEEMMSIEKARQKLRQSNSELKKSDYAGLSQSSQRAGRRSAASDHPAAGRALRQRSSRGLIHDAYRRLGAQVHRERRIVDPVCGHEHGGGVGEPRLRGGIVPDGPADVRHADAIGGNDRRGSFAHRLCDGKHTKYDFSAAGRVHFDYISIQCLPLGRPWGLFPFDAGRSGEAAGPRLVDRHRGRPKKAAMRANPKRGAPYWSNS
ncbi:hypothetical protein [Cohnella rhizosphaerae]|uniref:Uncharacterized protein n=1 Tax=Cohnella rhizosphaerae TaxID=1457232 RepID=A0A9X4KYU5_9BACL|nr:hypothetical protein [Cohnella rhizosphaerae]MDG0813780.1 hypothetical protein [Cohnella rhizosphaerae]